MDAEEYAQAKEMASSYLNAHYPIPKAIGKDSGNAFKALPGLYIMPLGYRVDCTTHPHTWYLDYRISAHRLHRETKLWDSLPNPLEQHFQPPPTQTHEPS